jgi:hypothetical protein
VSAEQLPVQMRSHSVPSAHTVTCDHKPSCSTSRDLPCSVAFAFVSLLSVPTEVLHGIWYVVLPTAAAHMHTMCMQCSMCRV